jgi:glycosyltransferase involved in cell wall biosynthesis
LKIAVVVQGRFHAFDLARALMDRGHDVTLFTNYPKWAVKRFGFNPSRVRSFWLHGLLSRLAYRIRRHVLRFEPDRWLHPMFGRWAAGRLARERWDVVHAWSGVSEEILQQEVCGDALKLVMRGSAHIHAQSRLLEQEERRAGCRMDRPGPWIMAREKREYGLADRIVVLSTFAYDTFVQEGFGRTKLRCLPLGASNSAFRPDRAVIEARCRRILSGDPLRVLYVGLVAPRKGLVDIASVIRSPKCKHFQFRLVGPVTAEAKTIVAELSHVAEFIPKQPQHQLSKWYAWGDVFVFPTIEDGFAVVLAQASSSGLPIVTTTNCCGPDLIKDDETGWVLPIRSPEAFVERLLWCDCHRDELVQMVRKSYLNFWPRDWADVAADFESLCELDLALVRNGE